MNSVLAERSNTNKQITKPNYLIYFEVETEKYKKKYCKQYKIARAFGRREKKTKNVPSAGRVESVFDSFKFVHI